ncbi:MAG: c-type cytochrome biogenesis protein CcsB [Gammaproteobacteria bacterium]|nr:c-type cytochrome biogenesis protein CcsB [Gammaproteobacteria bacterium]
MSTHAITDHAAPALAGRRALQTVDYLWGALLLVGVVFVYASYRHAMNGYEWVIFAGTTLALGYAGGVWPELRRLLLVVVTLALLSIYLYGADLGRGEEQFLLQYFLASQSAIMWMSALFVLATLSYFLALFSGSEFPGAVATGLTWCGAGMGLVGMLVRWHESYLISPDVGHIPVSNLYEVFILFCVTTAIIYLHYEKRYRTRALGGFVLLVIGAAIGFLLWYTFDRGAHEIQPLVPALQSYWMKIHVPANFIGYGCFSIAAMLGLAYLAKGDDASPRPLLARLPARAAIDDMMYKAIALGFAFFTIATILGSLWAAEAWGGYWSWDPKETWALIVWLNYAAWLHVRISKNWHGSAMAAWAIVGLFVTLFAFLGVNMFLSGLHSYGEL